MTNENFWKEPERIGDEIFQWREREQRRFINNEYRVVPWMNEPWHVRSYCEVDYKAGYHFAHVSNDDPTKVAFTENDAKGIQDVQTRMKTGRYLNRFFGDVLSESDVQYWAGKFAAANEKLELKLAWTADEIEWVYVNGPRSCMGHSASGYSSHVHPVRAYAAGDLAIAYLERDGEVKARVVCWPERKIYTRIYGDEHRLKAALEEEGYTYDEWGLRGASLLKIEDGENRVVVPYVDYHPWAEDCGDCLEIHEGGEISLETTDGFSQLRRGEPCDNCGDETDPEDLIGVDGEHEYWCPHCWENDRFLCEDCNRDYHERRLATEEPQGRIVCEDCFEYYAHCDHCEEYHDRRDVQLDVLGDSVCDDCSRDWEINREDEPIPPEYTEEEARELVERRACATDARQHRMNFDPPPRENRSGYFVFTSWVPESQQGRFTPWKLYPAEVVQNLCASIPNNRGETKLVAHGFDCAYLDRRRPWNITTATELAGKWFYAPNNHNCLYQLGQTGEEFWPHDRNGSPASGGPYPFLAVLNALRGPFDTHAEAGRYLDFHLRRAA